MRVFLALSFVAAVAVLPACGSSSASTKPAAAPVQYVDKTSERTVTITARDDFFTPQFTKVRAGTTVVFENDGRNEHNLVSSDNAFARFDTGAFAPGKKVK